MQKTWLYRKFEVDEGMKPGSKHFQYFFVVREGERKKCRYCVWIEDDALPRMHPTEDWDAIVATNLESWQKWVREKLDRGDFRDLVLKYGKDAMTEVNLGDLEDKLTMD